MVLKWKYNGTDIKLESGNLPFSQNRLVQL
jgi:hypothetical protein